MLSKLQKVIWQIIVVLLTLAISVLAIKALYGVIQSTSWEDISNALTQIPIYAIVLAVLIVAIAYLILTLYDAIALEHLDIDLPFNKVALISFTAYAIGHTIGFAVLSAAGVRYRMYRAQSIKASDIAHVIWLVSMAFIFGLSTLVALSLALNPDATVTMMAQLDIQLQNVSVGIPQIFRNAVMIRVIGIVTLLTIAVIIVWSGKTGKHIKIRGWRFDLPPAAMLIKQIIISIVDLASVAFVLYILLPHDVGISYWMVFSAFIQSTILAILSHVPGGLGVFEITMVASLPQVDKPYLLAVLLIFRLLYYILPFLVAVCFFMVHEVWLQSKLRRNK